MIRSKNEILSNIDKFEPSAEGNWLGLDTLLAELWQSTKISEDCLPVLFRVFERFPDDPSAEVCWGIIHGIESANLDYEKQLRESLLRQPSHLGKIMLFRLEKSKVSAQQI
ncbi:hypothetical protein F506_03695 [Herbaspirillum hiltneri N3]|uniref:Uncharacterized protein n=1 Tax=Herbaspirillum hiltneri N3 TaxID=1262470 RepID=A0ABM5UXI5_9BURK|nr:hypothetical protein [Herbaspirillum hiltneri]AKZ61889.1 hypothetical protein F506_03695 [Herbaspirillum hiltneri N3]